MSVCIPLYFSRFWDIPVNAKRISWSTYAGKFKKTRKGLFFLGEKADILSLSIVII